MEMITLHGGMTPRDLLAELQSIVKKAKGRKVVVLLDEVNSSPAVWSVKDIVCDRTILGRRVPDNLQFICIMNPFRRRKTDVDTGGLDFSPYLSQEDQQQFSAVEATRRPLVYQVHRSPESLMSLVWDFGKPSNSAVTRQISSMITQHRTPFPEEWSAIPDEIIFAENMIHWMIKTQFRSFENGDTSLYNDFRTCEKAENTGLAHLTFVRVLMCALLRCAQEHTRVKAADVSGASLRDVERTVLLISFLMNLQKKLVQFDPLMASQVRHPYFRLLARAISSSFVINYALGLSERDRPSFYAKLRAEWIAVRVKHAGSISRDFLPAPQDDMVFYKEFNAIAERLCNCLAIDPGMAINQALKENVVSLFCSIMGDLGAVAQFIVGRPGSTKVSIVYIFSL